MLLCALTNAGLRRLRLRVGMVTLQSLPLFTPGLPLPLSDHAEFPVVAALISWWPRWPATTCQVLRSSSSLGSVEPSLATPHGPGAGSGCGMV